MIIRQVTLEILTSLVPNAMSGSGKSRQKVVGNMFASRRLDRPEPELVALPGTSHSALDRTIVAPSLLPCIKTHKFSTAASMHYLPIRSSSCIGPSDGWKHLWSHFSDQFRPAHTAILTGGRTGDNGRRRGKIWSLPFIW
jgi:hypothetical protein